MKLVTLVLRGLQGNREKLVILDTLALEDILVVLV